MDARHKAALESLRIATINYLSTDEYKRRMIDHKWEEFLVFQPVQKLTTEYCSEPSCLEEEPCPQTDAQVTLCCEGCRILHQWARRSWGICRQFRPLFPEPS